jgi:hypothetical protein
VLLNLFLDVENLELVVAGLDFTKKFTAIELCP